MTTEFLTKGPPTRADTGLILLDPAVRIPQGARRQTQGQGTLTEDPQLQVESYFRGETPSPGALWVRVLGPDHPAVLTTRNNIAGWTAQSGGDAGHESEADPDGPKGESKISGS